MGKFYDYKIKYRTMNQLMDSVSDDVPILEDNSNIDPSTLIKVIRKINKQLGLRVTKTREGLFDLKNWMLNLPDDMESLNFAVLCTFFKNSVPAIQGTITEHVDVDCTHGCSDVWMTECGDTFQITQRVLPALEKIFNIEKRIKIVHSQYNMPNDVCGFIINDNFMKLNIECGKVYLSYEGILEDADGNLLVVDHPMINDYYEYAIKERVLENMYFRGEDVERKLALISQRLQVAKREAYNVTNMPEFKELEEVSELNRVAMYKKYFSIFI